MVAVAPLEARIARRLARLHAAKERLVGAVDAQHHVLQDLAVDLGILGHGLFDAGQFGLLLVVVHRDAAHPPRFPPLADGGVVDVAAEHQGTLKLARLFGRGLELVRVALARRLFFHIHLFCLLDTKTATIGRPWP